MRSSPRVRFGEANATARRGVVRLESLRLQLGTGLDLVGELLRLRGEMALLLHRGFPLGVLAEVAEARGAADRLAVLRDLDLGEHAQLLATLREALLGAVDERAFPEPRLFGGALALLVLDAVLTIGVDHHRAQVPVQRRHQAETPQAFELRLAALGEEALALVLDQGHQGAQHRARLGDVSAPRLEEHRQAEGGDQHLALAVPLLGHRQVAREHRAQQGELRGRRALRRAQVLAQNLPQPVVGLRLQQAVDRDLGQLVREELERPQQQADPHVGQVGLQVIHRGLAARARGEAAEQLGERLGILVHRLEERAGGDVLHRTPFLLEVERRVEELRGIALAQQLLVASRDAVDLLEHRGARLVFDPLHRQVAARPLDRLGQAERPPDHLDRFGRERLRLVAEHVGRPRGGSLGGEPRILQGLRTSILPPGGPLGGRDHAVVEALP